MTLAAIQEQVHRMDIEDNFQRTGSTCDSNSSAAGPKNLALRLVAIISLGTCLSGCEKLHERYVNFNSPSREQFLSDRVACYQEIQQQNTVAPTCKAFDACLRVRGYIRADTKYLSDFTAPGSFSVPAWSSIHC
jgi:hypothetical protein